MLNMYGDFKPKFVKTFADVGKVMREGLEAYVKEVRDGTFPAKEHTFGIKDEVLEKLY
jgi:3-methyl-2-oxobutanoate hydroxymethyltransferase